MNRFKQLQDAFIDRVDAKRFIGLDTSILFYNMLQESLNKPLKMILLVGKPGTGKSVLINKIYHDSQPNDSIFMIEAPMLNEKEFIRKLYAFLLPEHPFITNLSFSQFIRICRSLAEKRQITVLLDEAQLYPSSMLEKIRLISDTRAIKFVVSLHKTEREDLIAKEHFQSRIWETIELKNGTIHDTQMYIQKKIIQANGFEVANMFNMSNIKLVHHFTKGNYREINKIIYTLFEIYEYYEQHKPSRISGNHIKNKYIEMSALKVGYIHA